MRRPGLWPGARWLISGQFPRRRRCGVTQFGVNCREIRRDGGQKWFWISRESARSRTGECDNQMYGNIAHFDRLFMTATSEIKPHGIFGGLSLHPHNGASCLVRRRIRRQNKTAATLKVAVCSPASMAEVIRLHSTCYLGCVAHQVVGSLHHIGPTRRVPFDEVPGPRRYE